MFKLQTTTNTIRMLAVVPLPKQTKTNPGNITSMVSIHSARRKLQSSRLSLLSLLLLLCLIRTIVDRSLPPRALLLRQGVMVDALQSGLVVRQIARHRYRTFPSSYLLTRQYQAKSIGDDDDDNDNQAPVPPPGMAEAFRQLESLKSLDDPEEYIPAPDKINVDVALADTSKTILLASTTDNAAAASPEQDFAVYRNMMEEMEVEESAVSYTEVLDELGGSALQTDDTYSQIMTELGGTKKMKPMSTSESFSSWTKTTRAPNGDDVADAIPKSNGATLSNEQLLDEALKEALNEVQLNNPQISERSILNDQEIMQEIESIFDRGSAQLIEGLEEIRREQQILAESKSTNTQSNSELVAKESDNVKRLQNAERNIQTILQRVNVETSNLEQAVEDLNAANRQIENDFVWKLKRGGIPKQAALAGLLLFSVRSIGETITAVSSVVDSEAHLYAALIQGVVAMVCAVVFFLL